MSLPTDVVDHILSSLLPDLVTLKICAQSHPTLCKLAERYIYADIRLHDRPEDLPDSSEIVKTSEFAQIVTERREIATYLRSLTIYLRSDEGDSEIIISSYLDTMASILPLFSGLMKIELVGNNSQYRGAVPWNALPATFRQAFLGILPIQGMKHVLISGLFFFPLSLLDTCKNLRITLNSCERIQYNKEFMEDPLSHPLEHLSVRYCCDSSTTMENVTAWVQAHALRSLMFEESSDAKDIELHLQRLLAACSNSLKILEVIIAKDEFINRLEQILGNENTHIPFSLTGLFHVERFIFRYPRMSLYTMRGIHPSIMAITKLLHTSPPTVKQVCLKFKFEFETLPVSQDIWSVFIPLAAKCSTLSITLHISVRMTIRSGPPPPYDAISSVASCGGLLPYVDKGILSIEFGRA